jgi:hypothetical protein
MFTFRSAYFTTILVMPLKISTSSTFKLKVLSIGICGQLTSWVSNTVEHIAGLDADGSIILAFYNPANPDGWRVVNLSTFVTKTAIEFVGTETIAGQITSWVINS